MPSRTGRLQHRGRGDAGGRPPAPPRPPRPSGPGLAGGVAGLGLSLLAILACSANGPPAEAPASLPGTAWVLERFGDDSEPLATDATRPDLELGEDGRLTGSAGCNGYVSSYELAESSGGLEIGRAVVTRRLCGPEVMAIERRYLDALKEVRGYSLEAERLRLVDEAGRPLLAFVPAEPGSDAAR